MTREEYWRAGVKQLWYDIHFDEEFLTWADKNFGYYLINDNNMNDEEERIKRKEMINLIQAAFLHKIYNDLKGGTMNFEQLYEKQREFEDLILMKSKSWPNKPLKDYDEKEKIAFSKELSLYLYQEIGEYVNAVGNYRMHKQKADNKPVKDVKEEIADIMIFALDLALVNGMNAEELLQEITKKQDKNFKRQMSGY
jgi:NTP pyrophosphatase (non-canonical NTP hydrolase)